jgi:hypothetical protein
MDVLIPDTTVAAGGRLAVELTRRGHRVRTCKRPGQASACAVLAQRPCPLEAVSVDVALCVGSLGALRGRGDGTSCAVTCRVPLVMIDVDPGDPLAPLAVAISTEADAIPALEAVAGGPLSAHTAVADKVMRDELEHAGTDAAGACVEVRRRSGRLSIELWRGPCMTSGEAQKVVAHVVQAVREYDRWARGVDVHVHTALDVKRG